MKNPLSSSPADHRTRIACVAGLAAGPLLVILASLASAWLAVASDDGVVAQNYYRRGLLINRTLHANDAAHEALVAVDIAVAPSGVVSVHVDGAPHARDLVLVISRRGGTETVRLTETDAGSYVGKMHDTDEGRRVVTLRGDGWQLPTTVTDSLRSIRFVPATPLRIP